MNRVTTPHKQCSCHKHAVIVVSSFYQGGMYVFNLFDIQSGGISLLFIGFCEAAVIGWGVGKLANSQ